MTDHNPQVTLTIDGLDHQPSIRQNSDIVSWTFPRNNWSILLHSDVARSTGRNHNSRSRGDWTGPALQENRRDRTPSSKFRQHGALPSKNSTGRNTVSQKTDGTGAPSREGPLTCLGVFYSRRGGDHVYTLITHDAIMSTNDTISAGVSRGSEAPSHISKKTLRFLHPRVEYSLHCRLLLKHFSHVMIDGCCRMDVSVRKFQNSARESPFATWSNTKVASSFLWRFTLHDAPTPEQDQRWN